MDTTYIFECLQVILRGLHMVTVIAWIGASFYFVWLDNHLQKPASTDLKEKGVDGELWAVHGGGFYNPQKYMVAPPQLPQNLHWFYWESYSTWMSGMALFVVTYLMNANAMLIDSQLLPMTQTTAVCLAVAFMIVSWFIYDTLCRVLKDKESILLTFVFGFVALLAYLTCHVFLGRGAFLITGASIATIMTANVFFVIIPGQRKVIELMRAGKPVDPVYGRRGKQRSVHNTYFTLPVLFTMMSNHFGSMTSHPKRWLILIAMMTAAVAVRHFFVLRHKGIQRWWLVALASAILLGAFFVMAPKESPADDILHSTSNAKKTIYDVIHDRCDQCHSAHPTLVTEPPKGVLLRTNQEIDAQAAAIYTQVVLQKSMPLGNVTNITDDERDIIKRWFQSR